MAIYRKAGTQMGSSSQPAVTVRTDNPASIDSEMSELTQQVADGNLAGFREYLARTRANGDWQDRVFVLGRVAPKVCIDALDTACSAEPEASDLFITRCAYYGNLAETMRGTGT